MSLRSRPKDLTDRFESKDLGTFNVKPALSNAPHETPHYQTVPNLTIPRSLEVVSLLLLDYQSKFFIPERDEDANHFHTWFPFAWHTIKVDDEIKNISNGDIYKVMEIILTHPKYKRNYVALRGPKAPEPWHILRMDNRRNYMVEIIPAWPDAESRPYEFDKEGNAVKPEGGHEWSDLITYTVIQELPGSLNGKMFETSMQERVPRFREERDGSKWYGQKLDVRIRFDFWTLSNDSSEQMREWFRDFSNKYRWLIESNGLERFLWASSGTTEHISRWRNDIIHRSAFYDFRTEYGYSEDLFTIRSGEIQVAVPGKDGEQVWIQNSF